MAFHDRLGVFVLGSSLAAFAWLGLTVWAMVAARQPVRRRCLARAGAIGALAIAPIVNYAGMPKIDVLGLIQAASPKSWHIEGGQSLVSRADDELPGWFCLLSGAYAAGLTIQLGRLFLGHWGTVRLTRKASAPSRGTLDFYKEMPFSNERRRPVLLVSERLSGPSLLGIFRPVIVIPRGLERPEAREQLRLCLLHELAHAESRDPLFVLIAGLARAVWFFLPQAWWIRAQMRLDQEYLADHHASHTFGPFGAYAASLVGLADTAEFDRLPPERPIFKGASWSSALWSAGSALMRRILMLVRCPFPVEAQAPTWWRRSLAVLTILGVLATSTLSLKPNPTLAGGSIPKTRVLSIASLTVSDRPFALPVAAPKEYQLNLEAYGDTATLADVRVCGHRLGKFPVLDDQEDWHLVRVVRDSGGTSVSLDGRAAFHAPADGFSTPPHITVQPPPRQTLKCREILLRW